MGCCESRIKEPSSSQNETYDAKSIIVGTNRSIANEFGDSPTPENRPQKSEFDTFANNKPNGFDDIDISDIQSEKTVTFLYYIQVISSPNKPQIKKIGEFILKLFIESIEINYKFCDDFGSYFIPFIEVIFENQVKIVKLSDGEDVNNSVITDISLNTSINTTRIDQKNLNVSLMGKEKLYYYKKELFFNGNEKFYNSFIILTIKNEFSSHNSMMPITIGDNRIPINILINANKERSFEGQMEIKLRNLTTIGLIKLKIQVDDQNSAKILSTISNRRILEDMESSNDFNAINIEKKLVTWDKNIFHYFEIDLLFIEKYFLRDKKLNQSSK